MGQQWLAYFLQRQSSLSFEPPLPVSWYSPLAIGLAAACSRPWHSEVWAWGPGQIGSLPDYVNKPLKQIANISGWASDENLDPNFRHGSRTLLKRAERGGNGGQWDEVALAASKQAGWRNRLGKRRARQEMHGERSDTDLGDGWSLRSLNSCQELERVGREYRNCLRGGRYGHHRRLKEGRSRFFELCHAQPDEDRQGALLLEINDEGEVEHTEGREDDEATLEYLTQLAGGRGRLQRLLLKVRRSIAPLGYGGLLADAGADPAFWSN